MRRFEPLPSGVAEEWLRGLAGKSLDDIIAFLGSPIREHAASEWFRNSPGRPIEIIRHTRSLEFAVADSPVKTILIHVCEDGHFDWEFRGRGLVESAS